MSDVKILLAGQASADVLADLNASNAAAASLVNALKTAIGSTGTATTIANEQATANRPNTGVYSTDSFTFLSNPASSSWPSFKNTPIPFTTSADASFGTWDSAKTVFTFTTKGIYNLCGCLGCVVVGGADVNSYAGAVGRILLQQNTTLTLLTTPLNSALVPGQIVGDDHSFSIELNVNQGDTISILGSRSKYSSSQSDDIIGTNYGGWGALSNWVRITRLR